VNVFVVTLAVLGGWLSILPGTVETLYLHLSELDVVNLPGAYSFLLSAGWAMFLVALIVGGRLGDRSAHARSWVIASGILGLATSGLWLAIASTPESLGVAWIFLQIPAALIVTSSLALAITHVAPHRRRAASAFTGSASIVSIIVGVSLLSLLNLSTTLTLAYPSLVASVMCIPLLLLSRRPSRFDSITDAPKIRLAERVSVPPRRDTLSRHWLILLLAGFLLSSATAITNGYVVVFISKWVTTSADDTASFASLVIVVAGLASVLSGIFFGLRMPQPHRAARVYAFASILVGLAIATMVLGPAPITVAFAGAIFGFAFGAANGLELTLVAHLQPSKVQSGLGVGLFTASTTLPYILMPIVAAALLSADEIEGIRWLWWTAVATSVCAGIMMLADHQSKWTQRRA
jgi:MFS family permease